MDALQISALFPEPPVRVVSLVPSITESLFDLGFGAAVVGVTDYCVSPAELTRRLPKVGGPLDARLDAICALNPQLVIAGKEENPRALVDGLRQAGIPVWLLDVHSIAGCLLALRDLAGIFKSDRANLQLDLLEKSVEWVQATYCDLPRWRYLCALWQAGDEDDRHWVVFNDDTYTAQVLALFGGENAFAGRQRRYPLQADLSAGAPEDTGQRDTRYPRVSASEIQAAGARILLLPSEPYLFSAQDAAELKRISGAERVTRLDGSLIAWYGTRLGRALTELPQVLLES